MKNVIKVLVVDDDKAVAQALSEVVKRMGFKPIMATKPVDALNIVRLQTVHAAIVDVLLPKMTGVELVTEFRRTKFGDAPVIFISGVFKDKSFANDTMKNTQAVDFLSKPVTADVLTEVLTRHLQKLLSAERWSVQNLLTRKLSSDRERAKAIENLEQIKGLDFPLVLSILMEVGSSGHLNIVNDAGEIFGVSLVKGTIAEVDSTESQSTGVLALISKGYLSQEDWDEFQKSGTRKFSLERLVEEGFVSPHAVTDARKEQILYDFRSICSAQTLQVNFVPREDNEEPPKHAVTLPELLNLLRGSIDEFFPPEYLTTFYESVIGSPIRVVHSAEKMAPIWSDESFKSLQDLRAAVEAGQTLETALQQTGATREKVYQGLHFLVLNRAVMFDDLNRAKNLNSMLERYQKLYNELKDKTPDKIFEYFGAQSNSPTALIQTIYDEYAKSSNPDQLGKDATPELRELCRKCFDLVTAARNVLVDDTQKEILFTEIRARQSENHKLSMQMMNEGLETLRKGQAVEAFAILQKAEGLASNSRLVFIGAWAEIKAGAHANKPRLQELMKKCELANSEEKKSPFYFMAMGLIKLGLGDPTSGSMFERALQADSEFVEARRELRKLHNPTGKSGGEAKKVDLFTGDITEIVSQIFRRKAD
jgi:FixJ family two-component response regulator